MSKRTFQSEYEFSVKCLNMLCNCYTNQECEHWFKSASRSLERLYLENKKRVLDYKYGHTD